DLQAADRARGGDQQPVRPAAVLAEKGVQRRGPLVDGVADHAIGEGALGDERLRPEPRAEARAHQEHAGDPARRRPARGPRAAVDQAGDGGGGEDEAGAPHHAGGAPGTAAAPRAARSRSGATWALIESGWPALAPAGARAP